MGATCSINGVKKTPKNFGEKSYGKGQIGRPTQTCGGNIKTLKVTDILGTDPTFSNHDVFINLFCFLHQRINQGIPCHTVASNTIKKMETASKTETLVTTY